MSRRVIVYRYERRGCGPYNCPRRENVPRDRDYGESPQGWEGQNELNHAHGWRETDLDAHPSWRHDDIIGLKNERWLRDNKYVSGCPSRKALDAWFEGWHDRLLAAGFRVRRYRIPAERVVIGKSGTQLAFAKGRVKGEVVT